MEKEKIDKAREQDRALFDFDEDIDNLEEVDERYPANNKVAKGNNPIEGEESAKKTWR